ncbi:O-sialoglycoprotein endopeptidase [Alkaliphilus pronyensis]|uniref:N(6)-L-threonylcarbamoyladenine synthase n=1 Tax=Alkaliphilus pronyensis TaxID=1482732 RepID=A0A6I0FLT2_9FIRM|nr:O-sialoglycoprotein endopeptidase [Alkaliphilus pronyensis]KAB3537384.1 O-sialoglycoprotein endopeptidase [Alkaliphilus pronyensis]
MNKSGYILGIDTSNYTTSLSLVDLMGNLVDDIRMMLPVELGNVGLRQSDALFHHIKNIPQASKPLMDNIKLKGELVAIAAATTPRPVKDSYMPVFMAAKSYGETIANILQIPFYEFSHQEGHIEAGIWSIDRKVNKEFMVLHISGGTTELLKVDKTNSGYNIEIAGGTSDLSAGQFIDRIGVKLGLPFPAGPTLEELALKWRGNSIEIPVSVKQTEVSFSGPETFLRRKINEIKSKEQIAYSVFSCIGSSLSKLIINGFNKYPLEDIIIVGGVAANSQIKSLIKGAKKLQNINIHFADSRYCSDNAVGIAILGLNNYLRRNKV